MRNFFSKTLRRAALTLVLAAVSGLASAGVMVSIDTRTFGVAGGYLDFQFSSPGNGVEATALMSSLVGFDHAVVDLNDNVTPQGGGYLFSNLAFNELAFAVDFNSVYSFDLSFAGAADPVSGYISNFSITAFDSLGNLVGNYDPVTGAIAQYLWTPPTTPGGSGSIGNGPGDPGAVVTVPEPSDWLLTGTGLALMALVLRRRRATGAAPAQMQALAA
ncbi:hypothetical protein ASD15_21725 [Massilia sp. Root351]|jgi:hypothetical protein|uniref:NF038129 family PEP-CTERM protein n=1 Tax=Massilia sp. Root351 TaxID=1736522 RepID=UPI000708EB87|nr:NF038129 family PEP-CTERM protein [Massilia sp. Root351]KQV78440.1 hypothetical protein ASD15_21725 [Massilia sp. Root351]